MTWNPKTYKRVINKCGHNNLFCSLKPNRNLSWGKTKTLGLLVFKEFSSIKPRAIHGIKCIANIFNNTHY